MILGMDTRRRTYAILVGIILLTVPCYLSGIALLSRAPNRGNATPTPDEPGSSTVSPTPTDATRLPPVLVSLTPPAIRVRMSRFALTATSFDTRITPSTSPGVRPSRNPV